MNKTLSPIQTKTPLFRITDGRNGMALGFLVFLILYSVQVIWSYAIHASSESDCSLRLGVPAPEMMRTVLLPAEFWLNESGLLAILVSSLPFGIAGFLLGIARYKIIQLPLSLLLLQILSLIYLIPGLIRLIAIAVTCNG